MNEGRIVEELTAAELRAGKARDPYTRRLLAASRGYVGHARVRPGR
jgi:peptide/nickel transport system ATP-binding protein